VRGRENERGGRGEKEEEDSADDKVQGGVQSYTSGVLANRADRTRAIPGKKDRAIERVLRSNDHAGIDN